MNSRALDILVDLLRYLINSRHRAKDDAEFLERKLDEFVEACDGE